MSVGAVDGVRLAEEPVDQRAVGQLDGADGERWRAPRPRSVPNAGGVEGPHLDLERRRRRSAHADDARASAAAVASAHHAVGGRRRRCARTSRAPRSVSWWLSGWPSRWAPHTASGDRRRAAPAGAGGAMAGEVGGRAPRPAGRTRPGRARVTPNGRPSARVPDGHRGRAPVEQVAAVGEAAERGVDADRVGGHLGEVGWCGAVGRTTASTVGPRSSAASRRSPARRSRSAAQPMGGQVAGGRDDRARRRGRRRRGGRRRRRRRRRGARPRRRRRRAGRRRPGRRRGRPRDLEAEVGEVEAAAKASATAGSHHRSQHRRRSARRRGRHRPVRPRRPAARPGVVRRRARPRPRRRAAAVATSRANTERSRASGRRAPRRGSDSQPRVGFSPTTPQKRGRAPGRSRRCRCRGRGRPRRWPRRRPTRSTTRRSRARARPGSRTAPYGLRVPTSPVANWSRFVLPDHHRAGRRRAARPPVRRRVGLVGEGRAARGGGQPGDVDVVLHGQPQPGERAGAGSAARDARRRPRPSGPAGDPGASRRLDDHPHRRGVEAVARVVDLRAVRHHHEHVALGAQVDPQARAPRCRRRCRGCRRGRRARS